MALPPHLCFICATATGRRPLPAAGPTYAEEVGAPTTKAGADRIDSFYAEAVLTQATPDDVVPPGHYESEVASHGEDLQYAAVPPGNFAAARRAPAGPVYATPGSEVNEDYDVMSSGTAASGHGAAEYKMLDPASRGIYEEQEQVLARPQAGSSEYVGRARRRGCCCCCCCETPLDSWECCLCTAVLCCCRRRPAR